MELRLTIYLFCFSAIGATVESRFGRQTAYNSHQPSYGSANDNRPILVLVNSNPSYKLHSRPSSLSSSEEDLTRSGLVMKILRLPRIKQIERTNERSHTNNVSHKKRPQEVKHNLRTQVLKDLLSLRNSLRCRQQVECKSKCYRQVSISMDVRQGDGCDCGCQCEQKYECEVDDVKESSCSSEGDDCGFDTNPSTKSFI